MIFITVGSQKFQFNRLLKEVDNLIEKKVISEEVFAQIGYSDYIPKNYKFKKFLDKDEFNNFIDSSRIIITHGGTGSIISALKKSKKVIAIPRLSKYGEHVDDHQIQIVSQFEKIGFLKGISDISELSVAISEVHNMEFKSYISNTKKIIDEIDKFIINMN